MFVLDLHYTVVFPRLLVPTRITNPTRITEKMPTTKNSVILVVDCTYDPKRTLSTFNSKYKWPLNLKWPLVSPRLVPFLVEIRYFEHVKVILGNIQYSFVLNTSHRTLIQDTLEFPPNPFIPTWSLSKKFAMSTIPTWS